MLRVVGTAYRFFLLEEAVGKETPRVLSVLGASAVSCSSDKFIAETQSALGLRKERLFFRQTPQGDFQKKIA